MKFEDDVKEKMEDLPAKEIARITDKTPPKNCPLGDPIEPIYKGETAILIATGPSLNDDQLEFVKKQQDAGKCRVFTINNVYQRVPWTDAHLSCDGPWWRWYGPRSQKLKDLKCPKYTWYYDIAQELKEFGVKYIRAIEKPGLSLDPRTIHINHGSGPMWINLALHFGIKRLVLIGHDMKFAPDYKPHEKMPGSTPRHYFNEYPGPLQHWPSVKVGLSKPGVLDGLIEAYKKMIPQLEEVGMDVVNCTPDSALTIFRMSTLEEEFKE